ncbi:aldo/keto reductase [Phenylobacterium hankyongense]|uniref:Aldo/keto reductase n=1 Tax=Phenylobacterium hankyongense TaxID=1813876 RepID=A0A328B0Q8_9CAUL|nr:aldo/keto reductase [Phenylobacterium hankyongense]RAK60031.1 aldo/keto reductase [Phenylobacterium hankyongense]
MDYVRLGNTGLQVSRLCLGCMTYGSPEWRPWVLDAEQSKPFFQSAVEKGITFFDTANVYSLGKSEEVTGRWLKEFARREEVVVATKVYSPMGPRPNQKGLSRKHIMAQIDASLQRLGMDYVDLYQIHRFDYETPIEETLEALNDVVKAGKARYIGASSMYAWQFARMLAVSEQNGWARFVSMQPQYNLVYREEEREMLPLSRAEGVGVIPWSPLARGFLAGGRAAPGEGNTERARTDEFSPRLYYRDADHQVVQAVSGIAGERGLTNTQVALAWVLKNPAITAPIVGASKLHHLDEAVSALGVTLSDEEIARLEAPYQPKPVLDHG